MSTVQEIEQAALKLSPKKRVQLAERLFESLETKREKEIAETWADEAVARSAAFRKGKLKSLPLCQAFGFEV
jgi:putative addiction module component (TIGR02574 family)